MPVERTTKGSSQSNPYPLEKLPPISKHALVIPRSRKVFRAPWDRTATSVCAAGDLSKSDEHRAFDDTSYDPPEWEPVSDAEFKAQEDKAWDQYKADHPELFALPKVANPLERDLLAIMTDPEHSSRDQQMLYSSWLGGTAGFAKSVHELLLRASSLDVTEARQGYSYVSLLEKHKANYQLFKRMLPFILDWGVDQLLRGYHARGHEPLDAFVKMLQMVQPDITPALPDLVSVEENELQQMENLEECALVVMEVLRRIEALQHLVVVATDHHKSVLELARTPDGELLFGLAHEARFIISKGKRSMPRRLQQFAQGQRLFGDISVVAATLKHTDYLLEHIDKEMLLYCDDSADATMTRLANAQYDLEESVQELEEEYFRVRRACGERL